MHINCRFKYRFTVMFRVIFVFFYGVEPKVALGNQFAGVGNIFADPCLVLDDSAYTHAKCPGIDSVFGNRINQLSAGYVRYCI